MLATTTITWALLIGSVSYTTGQLQAMTTIQGFGSQEACHAAMSIGTQALAEHVADAPLMLCVPVDAAKPVSNAVKTLIQPHADLYEALTQ